jgi:uncharacterized protein (DUF362 family)
MIEYVFTQFFALPPPIKNTMPTVALTRCTNYNEQEISSRLQRQLDLLGGLQTFVKPGDTVLIKPNFIAPRSARHATQTHPAVIIELAKLLLDCRTKPFVADSPAWQNTFACAKKLKLIEPLKKLGVPIKQLDSSKKCVLGEGRIKVNISKLALDADVIINLPKFKSHQQLVATFAVKNMFGCVPGKQKALWHFRKGSSEEEFCRLFIEIYRRLNPALTIIDAVSAMDGQGPIRGRTRPLGWLIASTDPIACETICAKLINTQPDDYPIIRTAKKINFGCTDLDQIKIMGNDYTDKICTDFRPAKLIPIRFSLLHVSKSITKQLLLLLNLRKTK